MEKPTITNAIFNPMKKRVTIVFWNNHTGKFAVRATCQGDDARKHTSII